MTAKEKAKILVVEDDPGVAQLERRHLERYGYGVTTAGSVEKAFSCLRTSTFDLILLDYRLPGGMDGLDFFTRLKETGCSTAVILVTGFSNESTVVRALRAGVRDFVTKSPEFLDYLPEAVERVLTQIRTERQLAESEARLGAILSSAQDAIITTGPDFRVTYFNLAAEELFGCPASEALGRPISDYIPREPEPNAEINLTNLATWGHRGIRANGEEFPMEATVARGKSGGDKFYTVVVRDVTERERLAAERNNLLARLQLHIERMPLGYVLFSADLVVADWNPAAERVFGYRKQEALGLSPYNLVPPSFWEKGAELLSRIKVGDMTAHSVNENITKDGRTITCEWFNTPLQDAHGRFGGLLCLVQDVTKRLELERQLQQAQKMEAVGQLAGGVAHDFNNVLTVISGYTELMLAGFSPGDPKRGMVEEIFKAGERASLLTRQLLTFSRKEVVQPRMLDINVVVEGSCKMLRRLIGEDIRLVTAQASVLDQIMADVGQIDQILMNLAVNARDAMPQGGRLTLETANVILDEAYAQAHPEVKPGRYVVLTVSDTGCGMTDEVKYKIFEPFFTTKGAGKGTGLGLATVFGIVKECGGHINVQTQLGSGTTFKIHFPSAGQVAPSVGTPAAQRILPTGRGTVLLVEDDDQVRATTRFTLEALGYTVVEANSGNVALELCGTHQGTIDLLITDVVMPGMSGRQMAEAVTRQHPDMKVLYVSGYTDDAVMRHGIFQSETAFLQKPFTMITLGEKIRSLLAHRN